MKMKKQIKGILFQNVEKEALEVFEFPMKKKKDQIQWNEFFYVETKSEFEEDQVENYVLGSTIWWKLGSEQGTKEWTQRFGNGWILYRPEKASKWKNRMHLCTCVCFYHSIQPSKPIFKGFQQSLSIEKTLKKGIVLETKQQILNFETNTIWMEILYTPSLLENTKEEDDDEEEEFFYGWIHSNVLKMDLKPLEYFPSVGHWFCRNIYVKHSNESFSSSNGQNIPIRSHFSFKKALKIGYLQYQAVVQVLERKLHRGQIWLKTDSVPGHSSAWIIERHQKTGNMVMKTLNSIPSQGYFRNIYTLKALPLHTQPYLNSPFETRVPFGSIMRGIDCQVNDLGQLWIQVEWKEGKSKEEEEEEEEEEDDEEEEESEDEETEDEIFSMKPTTNFASSSSLNVHCGWIIEQNIKTHQPTIHSIQELGSCSSWYQIKDFQVLAYPKLPKQIPFPPTASCRNFQHGDVVYVNKRLFHESTRSIWLRIVPFECTGKGKLRCGQYWFLPECLDGKHLTANLLSNTSKILQWIPLSTKPLDSNQGDLDSSIESSNQPFRRRFETKTSNQTLKQILPQPHIASDQTKHFTELNMISNERENDMQMTSMDQETTPTSTTSNPQSYTMFSNLIASPSIRIRTESSTSFSISSDSFPIEISINSSLPHAMISYSFQSSSPSIKELHPSPVQLSFTSYAAILPYVQESSFSIQAMTVIVSPQHTMTSRLTRRQLPIEDPSNSSTSNSIVQWTKMVSESLSFCWNSIFQCPLTFLQEETSQDQEEDTQMLTSS